MPSEFTTTRRVEFADTDCAGIAHFTSFFRYMEEAEHAFLRSCGLSVRTRLAGGRTIGFPRLSVRGEFLEPVTFEDVVDVVLWVSRIGTRTIEYSCELSRQGTAVARARAVVIACLVEEGRSVEAVPLPETFRAALEESPRGRFEFREGGKEGDA